MSDELARVTGESMNAGSCSVRRRRKEQCTPDRMTHIFEKVHQGSIPELDPP